MEIVIKIDEKDYQSLKDGHIPFNVLDVIMNGTPLPKGHGRLIDADVVDDNIYDLTRSMDLNYGQISEVIDNAPTIIEADRSEDKE